MSPTQRIHYTPKTPQTHRAIYISRTHRVVSVYVTNSIREMPCRPKSPRTHQAIYISRTHWVMTKYTLKPYIREMPCRPKSPRTHRAIYIPQTPWVYLSRTHWDRHDKLYSHTLHTRDALSSQISQHHRAIYISRTLRVYLSRTQRVHYVPKTPQTHRAIYISRTHRFVYVYVTNWIREMSCQISTN